MGWCVRPCTSRRSRSDVDQMACVLPPHNRQCCLSKEEWAPQIDCYDPVPLLNRQFIDRASIIDGCTVHNDIQTPELLVYHLHGVSYSLSIAHIALDPNTSLTFSNQPPPPSPAP